VTLAGASIAGLDPRAFEVAIRAADSGQATDDARLRQIVDPVLAAGALPVALAQIPFNIRDGRLRVDPTTLDGVGGRAVVSGGYDMSADQADVRVNLASNAVGSANSRPEIQLFAAGSPDTLNRTIDVGSLSSWLAVRAIDRETRRLDAIERGEPPPVELSVPPSTAALPSLIAPTGQPPPGRDPRRLQPKAKVAPPRPPMVGAPPPGSQSSASQPSTPQPVANQQAAPLPPPIEVRPAPGQLPPAPKPKPRPPMVLAPPPANP